jgi:arsenate reductase
MYTLYGIKNCDTVKKARNWLDQNGIAYRFHDFRVDGLTPELLQHFAAHLDWNKLINRSSTSWRQLSADQQSDLTLDSATAPCVALPPASMQSKAMHLMLTIPTLIKRPILDTGGKLIIGFKAENYQTELL